MRRPLVLLLLLLAAVLATWAVSYRAGMHATHALASSQDAELEWLRHEFRLDDRQFAEVQRLHEEYDPVCDRLCTRMMTAQTNLRVQIAKSQSVTPEVIQALQDVSSLRQECQAAMLQQIYRVGQVMSPDQRQRYLEKMEPHVLRPEMRNAEAAPSR
ncbi:MAG: periplasmic heavy metal sensor [Verrucomicrobium sp.]|nr:periplasmic heavy metal sensor [Verrucomicrobium sp.]